MIRDGYFILDLHAAQLWLGVYAVIAILVALGFIVQRYGWGEPEQPVSPAIRALRIVVTGLVGGALWPLWAVIAAFGLFMASLT
jgi:hypothetical protein